MKNITIDIENVKRNKRVSGKELKFILQRFHWINVLHAKLQHIL